MSEATFSGNTIGDKALYLKGVERGEKDATERILKILKRFETHLPVWQWEDLYAEIEEVNK